MVLDASEWRERVEHSKDILVYTVIQKLARRPEIVRDVENGMFLGSDEL